VFLPTFRRPNLLPRAIESLRAQTFTGWICELHNDDPVDAFPAELLQRLGDPRIRLFQHERNLGPVASFNLFYQPVSEPFFSILEDDNGWEPQFLEKMLEVLAAFPDATLAWCNQRIWQESPDGSWQDTHSFVDPEVTLNLAPRLIRWGHRQQLMGAVHANGAMLMRSRPGQGYTTPEIPFAGVETYRERMVPHPLVYVPQPLANFSRTLQTARTQGVADWGAFQVIMAATFLRHSAYSLAQFKETWDHFDNQKPSMTNELIAAALVCREARPLLRFAGFSHWFRFLINSVRHPFSVYHKLRVRAEHTDWWNRIDLSTTTRFAEAASNPPAPLSSQP